MSTTPLQRGKDKTSIKEHHEWMLGSHIKQVSNKPVHRRTNRMTKKNIHLLTQNKRDAHIQMRLRKIQKEGMKGIQCQNPTQSYHKGEGDKEVTKELGELYENRA